MEKAIAGFVPVSDMERMATAVAKSGLFGVKTAEQALALMLVSQAEGRHPALAARDYDIIQGRPAKKAEAMLRDFLSSGGSVEWHQLDDNAADATFSHPQGGKVRISWDMERAKQAGLAGRDMFRKFPRQMLRSRTVSEGIRTVCPMATSGMYVPEEVQEFEPQKQIVERPVIKTEIVEDKPAQEPEAVVAELVESSERAVKALVPLDSLAALMWDAGIEDSHVIEFLYAKKVVKSHDAKLTELSDKIINRLIEKWDDVIGFKPAN